MKPLKEWQLKLIAPLFCPFHDLCVWTGRLADRYYTWTTEHTAEVYLTPRALNRLFERKPNVTPDRTATR